MAVANDCQFILAPALQQLFRDKDTGLPLSAGTVEFFVDTARTTLKPVFQKTGTPANPIFIELPNPVTLNMVGAFDTAIYYHPFDDQGVVELYFIEVKNSSGVLQFTREGYPDVCTDSDGNETLPAINYWENPQWRMRLDPPTGGDQVGELINALTPLGYGGYQFALPSNFTSTNIISYQTFTQTITDPEAHPPAAIIIECSTPIASEGFKDLRKEFFDVSFLAGEEVTLQFESQTDSGSISVDIIIINDYGPGGSPTQEAVVDTFTISDSSYSKQAFTFTMPDNSGQTVSANALDSSVFFAFRFPTSVLFQVRFTNFLLQKGASDIINFPDYSLSEDVSEALAGSMDVPLTDGMEEGKIVQLGTEQRNTGLFYPKLILSPMPNTNYIYGGNFGTNPWGRSTDANYEFDIDDTDDKKYTADRFQFVSPAGDPGREFVGQVRRSTNVPPVTFPGSYSQYSYNIFVETTAQTTTLDEPYYTEYVVEGFDWQNLAQQNIAFSFWISAPVAGTYTLAISNDARDTVYVNSYVVHQINTWEYKRMFIQASIPAGGWNYLNGRGLNVNWNWTPINNPTSPAFVWINPATPEDFVKPDQVNALGTVGNNIYLDNIKLEKGDVSSGFSECPYPELLNKLKRYYEKSSDETQIANEVGASSTRTMFVTVPITNFRAAYQYYTVKKRIPTEQGNPEDNLSNVYRVDDGSIGNVQLYDFVIQFAPSPVNSLRSELTTLEFVVANAQVVPISVQFGWWASAEF